MKGVTVTANQFPNNGCPAGTGFVPDAQPTAANAAAEAGMPIVPTRGKLGMEPSGNFTSPASGALRSMTGNARFAPLRGVTGTSSVGGPMGRALPFFCFVLVILYALADAQQQSKMLKWVDHRRLDLHHHLTLVPEYLVSL